MSDNDEQVDDPGVQRGRKRCRDPAKRQRNRGEEYVSRTTGRHVPARCVGAPCRDGCFDKITRPIVDILHSNFWQIGDFGLQNSFLQKHVAQLPVKRRRPVQNPNAARRRSATLQYTLSHCQTRYTLCKTGFLSILGISEARVKTAMLSMSSTGSPRGDLRGHHPPGVMVSREVVNRVLQHILSFPTVSSHYTRAKSPHMRYLEGHLNIRKLYRLYLLWMEEHYRTEKRVKLSFYRKKFRGFNLGFKPPMTDTCTRCDTFKVAIEKANPEAKAELRENNEKHLDLARRGQRLMKRGYCIAISGATIENQEVIVMRRSDFLDIDVLQKCVTVRKPRQPYSFKDARQFAFRLNFREGYQLAMDYDGPMGSVRLQKGNAGYRPSLFNLLKVTLPLKYLTVRAIDPCKIKHLEDFLDMMTVSQGQYLQYIIEQQRELTRNDTVEDEEDLDNDLDDHLDYEDGDGDRDTRPSTNPATSSQ
ncbi:hypothetical protein Pcinc_028734 [Petrolisthes cinctipes]|uniref:Uncharacterized protein n=1 Tax=Petrolisthes cinctipes TaxID=88211 RepID=A0AAE1F2A9_PETCI|nr:hypothetical protein Pcinc_028734 [Petrolisthes cinctipes]